MNHILKYLFCLIVILIIPVFGTAQVSANFTANTTSGCSPIIVQFSDLSSGPVTSWFWNFGNGNTSSAQNPSAIYVTPGNYTVTLTVTGGGGSNTVTRTAYITVFQNPTANLVSTTTRVGCEPLTVCFNDISTQGSGIINNWLWDFGDGSTSYSQNPCHTYNTHGTYTVSLLVTDINGCNNTAVRINYVTVYSTPIPSFSGNPTVGCDIPHLVNFSNLTYGGLGPYTSQWSFGDGGTSSQSNPAHTYTGFGAFDVSLAVTDAHGCSDTIVRSNYINIGDVTAAFTQSTTNICEGQRVFFGDNSFTNPISWQWSFGDGGVSLLQNPSHVYNTAGTYDVTLIVGNGACFDTITQAALINVVPAPVANFVADTTRSCELPFVVNFTDLTTGNPTAWYWEFGDGSTSTLQNPTHTYTAAGYDTVMLAVTGPYGCVDTFWRYNYIQIVEPNADFYATPIGGCIPLLVNFFDVSTSQQAITSWQWDFGDGSTSTLQNPTHTYTTVGQFTVRLIITNAWGCTDTLIRPNYTMAGTPPTACFTLNPPVQCAGVGVQFSNCSSNATNYVWSFGNGGGSTLVNPSYPYLDTGCFNVTLTALNFGCPNSVTQSNAVCILPPVALFQQSSAVGCGLPFTVNFTDISIAPDTWLWNFGDGTSSTQPSPSHTYTAVGTYNISLTVSDTTNGCSNTLTSQVIISDPQANFIANPTTACAPMTVNFINQSTGNLIYYRWDFGAPGIADTSLLANPSYTYQAPGYYSPTLFVRDQYGCTDQITRPNYILANGPNVNFVGSPRQGCGSLNVQFTDLTTSLNNLTSWFWNFGDGSTSTLQNPSHLYLPGLYSVSLRVTDATGCQRTFQRPFYINVSNPTASFFVSDSMTCSGMPLSFTSTSVGGNLTYQWNFGDGTTSTAQNPTHAYQNNGTYTVSLAIQDVSGCRDTMTSVALITIQDVLANFSANPTQISCPPALVGFTDLSSYDIIQWSWDFGDGGVSANTNPSHLYTTAGVFDVTLMVQNDDGCRDTIELPGLINIMGPTGTFTFDPDTGCTPQLINFSANATNAVSFTWDFGDGTVTTTAVDTIDHVYSQQGVYYPVLILDNGLGCQFSIVSTDSIVIDTLPIPAFSVNSNIVCGIDSVHFFDQTITNRPIVSWFWDFGDGTTSTLQNPVHLYPGIGTYNVTFGVVSAFGCTDTILFQAAIQVVDPPTVVFSPLDSIGCNPFSLGFTDASFGPQPVTAWIWDFGNGNSSVLQNPSQTFVGANTYQVSLIAVDNLGCRDTAYTNVIVNPGPSAGFVANDSMGCPPFPVTFSANTGMGIVSYVWEFGDGSGATGNIVNHTYGGVGNFDVTLIVTDTLGCVDTLLKPQYIQINPPIANYGSNVSSGCATLSVTFTDQTIAVNPITNFEWDFGDGSTGVGSPIMHNYPNPGFYTVTLIVTDSIGCKDTLVMPNYIEVFERPNALFGVTDTVACRPFSVQFQDSSFGAHTIAAWAWNFGDGQVSNAQNPIHGYQNPGNYNVVLIVTDVNGCRDTMSMIYNVPVLGLADFSVNNQAGCQPLSVLFNANSTNIIGYHWDFGDGQTSNVGPQVSHTYPNFGHYTVTLAVDDVFGCSDTLIRSNYIFVDSVDADFSVLNSRGCAPFLASFTDLSFSDTTLISWQWSFGDGGTSTLQNPTHTYLFPGVYNVSLIVTSILGCTDTISMPAITIFNNDPPPVTPLLMVTVENDVSDSLSWRASQAPDFDHYVIWFEQPTGSGIWTAIDSLYNVLDTSYTHQGLNTLANSYCYRLQVVDICGFRSDFDSARIHCTMDLDASPQVDQVVLNWNAYVGWDSVAQYDIYRVSNYNMTNAQFLATVSGGTTTYIDTNVVCYTDYCYRIEASEFGGFAEKSRSDTSCSVPIHIPFPIAMEICAATVVQDSFVEISWDLPMDPAAVRLKLERSLDGQNWGHLSFLPTTTTVFLDQNVAVHRQSYYYRITVVDSCGDLGPFSLHARTILLDAEASLGTPNLTWNAYSDWSGGVMNYQIEIRNDATQTWQQIALTADGQLNFVDDISNLNQLQYCYRVLATENGSTCRSLSNIDCVPIGPNLFVPNAFSPNGDNLNDFFEIKGFYISEFHIRIYDRWGMLIFESFDMGKSWSGKFNGLACQEGAYVWVIDAKGFNGEIFNKRGTCTLLR